MVCLKRFIQKKKFSTMIYTNFNVLKHNKYTFDKSNRERFIDFKESVQRELNMQNKIIFTGIITMIGGFGTMIGIFGFQTNLINSRIDKIDSRIDKIEHHISEMKCDISEMKQLMIASNKYRWF